MRYPNNLKKGGKIGFPAPSFGCTTEPYFTAFHHAMEVFGEMGYASEPGPNAFAEDGQGKSSTPEKCGAELMACFARDDLDVLISCGGGETMCEDLDYVNFSTLSILPPKWFMGFSDNTNMTFTLPTLADTAAIYGPCAGSFGMEPWHEELHHAMEIMTGERSEVSVYPMWENEAFKSPEEPLAPMNTTEERIHKLYLNGVFYEDARTTDISFSMKGRLLGGCMDCLVNLVGTPFDKVKEFQKRYPEGIVWFLESCDLNVFGIRRALWQLEHAGWFENAKGFLIGRPANGESILNMDAYNAVTGILGKYNVPIVLDTDFGHRPPMMPVIVGSLATVSGQGNDLKISMERK